MPISNFYSQMPSELAKQWAERDKAVKKLFSGQIKGSFLVEIKNTILSNILPSIGKYYDIAITNEKLISNNIDFVSIDFDICNLIVGAHNSNIIFLEEEQRVTLEKDDNYRKKLINTVLTHLSLRNYGSSFFRNKYLGKHEQFIYYPLPYDLFVISVRTNELLQNYAPKIAHDLFLGITQKCLAALSLFEDGLYSQAYPLCRGAIELYLKLALLTDNPEIAEIQSLFDTIELQRSQSRTGYPREFDDFFANRRQRQTTKINYLHFGWVDLIADYHEVVTQKPYSVEGMLFYQKQKGKFSQDWYDLILSMYGKCHAYTHGAIFCKYPLLHYFELSTMLNVIVGSTYQILCDLLQIDSNINGIDILDKAWSDFNTMYLQYLERSTENFEKHYKK